MPGTGRKPLSCKDAFPKGFCPVCGNIRLVSGNCGSPECPNCSTQWRYQRTETIFERLFSYKITKKTRLIHAVVSLPQAEIDLLKETEDIDDIRRILYRYLETKAFDGGLVIFHPWRLRKEKIQELQNIAMGLDEWAPGEFGLWKTLIKLENWRDFVYFSPHFHILGSASWLVPAFEGEGWVFKRIRDIKDPEDLIKVSMYLLSHAGISLKYGKKNVHWFGALSNSTWSVEKAPVGVQEYTKEMLNKELKSFSKEAGELSYLVCPDCMVEWVPMDMAPLHYSKFDEFTIKRLSLCYLWYSGAIPPPSEKELKKWGLHK